MPVTEQERRRELKKRFIMGGVAAGVLLSAGYLGLNLAGIDLMGAPSPSDPAGRMVVNVLLILAACILQASILGRVAGFLTRREEQKGTR